jgi:prepilin-type processing-associated H-X9-DG protein
LVVTAIISLLVSILLPSLQRAKDMAVQTQCLSNIRHTMHSTAFYGQENNDVILPCVWRSGQVVLDPAWGTYYDGYYTGPWAGYGSWPQALYPKYAENPWIWTCPAMREANLTHNGNNPSNPDTYPLHWWAATTYGLATGDSYPGYYNIFRTLAEIDNPSGELYFADTVDCPADGAIWEYAYLWKKNAPSSSGKPRDVPQIRHTGTCNAGFFDGHAEPVTAAWLDDDHWNYWIGTEDFVFGD